MVFPYMVVHNGKWYNAGEDVPTEEKKAPVEEPIVVEPIEEKPTRGRRKKQGE